MGYQPEKLKIYRTDESDAENPEDDFDFSGMSLDELLESVRRDIEPEAEDESGEELITEDPPDKHTAAAPVIAPRSRRWDEPAGAMSVAPRRRRSKFYKVLLVFAIVMLAAICAGAVYFWRYIDAYEASLPEHVIESLQEIIDNVYWEMKVEEAIAPLLTEFESEDLIYLQPYMSVVRDAVYSIRQKSDESTDDLLVYIVRAGARDIGIVRLVPSESAGYGFTMWEVGSVELLDSYTQPLSRSVSITVSQNAEVDVNGVPVSQEYRTDCDVEYGATYMIEGIYGELEVSVVEFNGRKSSPDYAEDGEYIYPVISQFSRKYDFIVPEGVNILVDGEKVPPASITDSLITPAIFEDVVDPADSPQIMVRYEFELKGLYTEPDVTIDDPLGRELKSSVSADGTVSYYEGFSEEYKTLYSGTVEAFIRAYVRFGANIGNSAEGNFSNLSGYMLRGSDLYRRTQASIEGMIWVSGTTVEYNSLEIDNFTQYGDSYFSCEVRYNITNRTYYEAREVEGNYEVLFVLSGDKWLAVKMAAL